jgi:glycosyltransferase involved in cell wall biosynthesis
LTPPYSAYVPCCNNAATIRAAVAGLWAQAVAPAEVIVVDDGSTDGSAEALAGLDVRIIRHERNLGRGAARARAMREARHELVLCCDATNVLPPDFMARALPWFADLKVAAVWGQIHDPAPRGVAGRWRNRHLFKAVPERSKAVRHRSLLATYGAVLRKTAAAGAGGFDPALRHSEDAVLGEKLLAGGWDVVFDPRLDVRSISINSLSEVLERYWRWNAGGKESSSLPAYFRQIWHAWRVMACADLAQRDLAAALISLACPHYCFWKSALRSLNGKRQRA